MPGDLFHPLRLTPDASLNQVVIGDHGPPDVAGQRAGDVCSRDALHRLADAAGLRAVRHDRLADDLGAAATSTDVRTAQIASGVLARFGGRFGALIATLRSAATPDQQGRTASRHAYLSHWLTVDSVWLAGGLLDGPAGAIILEQARVVAAGGGRPCPIRLNRAAALAPLVGAARHGPASGPLVVADLGHTSIKTALGQRNGGIIQQLTLLPSRPAPTSLDADDVEDAVVVALVPVVQRAALGGHGRIDVTASVACYVSNGVPVDDGRSVYSSLEQRHPVVEERLSAAAETDVRLQFVHDGTAAACTADETNSVTVTAGTWLGVGFHLAGSSPLLTLADDLRIRRGE